MTKAQRENLGTALRCAADLCITGNQYGQEISYIEDVFHVNLWAVCGRFYARSPGRQRPAWLRGTAKAHELLEVAAWVEDGEGA